MIKRLLCLLTLLTPLAGTADEWVPPPPDLSGKSYVMIDYNSGRVLAQKDADTRYEPASLTKLMTAYVAYQALAERLVGIEDEVTISTKAWRAQGSRTFIEVGKKVPLSILIAGMVIQSGNDASIAVAEHVAGSEDAFVDMMNSQAKKIGMKNSHFENSTGLPVDGHTVSAHDIALLSRALIMDFPDHYKTYSERDYTYNKITQRNRNRLLWRNLGVDGLKTGHTENAGYCLAASAQQGNMRLITVVLGDDSDKKRFNNTAELLRYGFRFYRSKHLLAAREELAKIRVWGGETDYAQLGITEDVYVAFPKNSENKLKAELAIDSSADAPLKKNTELGTVRVFLGDELLDQRPLISIRDVPEGGIFTRIGDSFLRLFE